MFSSAQSDWNLYEKGIESAFSQVEDLIKDISTSTGEDRQNIISQINSQLCDADKMIISLKSLIHEMPLDSRQAGEGKIKGYQARVQKLRTSSSQSARMVADNDAMRKNLLGNAGQGVEMGDLDGMERMRKVTSDLSKGTDILDDTILVATGTEDTATGILSELDKQKSTLHSIGEHNSDISGDLGQGAGLLRRMQIRAKQNSFIIIMIIIVIIALIALIIFFIVKDAIDKKNAGKEGQ
ncbi:vesicle transport through interaction with t-SNAREs (Vti1) [Monocercomonoides exilis]|uniref:vesicle transport through interaction with t-SNAREs (Vti1) n=1 Tax=Monocercomonoides exilis TaxID=2049356 RepID=UPI00355A7B54|nr:vesicle transport through interaction with t-SNAREs (Vti1) [Monocercomonoides exilis]|eukprot:MONOS_395.1-p1 / transcript=MONOS_395.1 / gene=MONOS_395 / organism=Monocercomonoides_exilis_PA203 / gene_product=vesicle transport through interaction with t-SNAREs homologue 1 (Vti1) / transcript_product=vesicle transport through interaction with t-SNAREs homologue 1 (Vti1) / location=Mono_scaffold00006:216960-217991(+) / protein_length=239 / sequence_SO=supercontig / SO=protein_coding / is_pseudo=false